MSEHVTLMASIPVKKVFICALLDVDLDKFVMELNFVVTVFYQLLIEV